jgi:hypothetical protein
MRLILTTVVVLCLSSSLSAPAYAAGPIGGGIGEGFTSAIGWALCDGVCKVVVKAVKGSKGKNHQSESAGADDSRGMTPEEVYNRGLEDGYARAREENGGSLYEGRYAREQGNSNQMQTDGAPGQNVQTRVYAKRLADSRVTAAKPAAAHRRSRYYSQNKQTTVAAGQTANSTGHRKPSTISASDKNRSKVTTASPLALIN